MRVLGGSEADPVLEKEIKETRKLFKWKLKFEELDDLYYNTAMTEINKLIEAAEKKK